MVIELGYPKGKDGKVICQECGTTFSMITPAHLKSHNMVMAEYRLKYPDCPISAAEYKASRFTYKDSVLFKGNEGIASDLPEEEIVEIIDKDTHKHSVLTFTNIPKNKVDILKFLHKAYPYLEDSYSIEHRHFHDDRLLYKYITDMADPVKKVLFDFPNAFWHNQDPYPDFQKFDILKADGWIVIIVDKHYPTVQDVLFDIDIISD